MIDGKITKIIHGYHGFGYNNFGILANDGVKVSHGKIYYDDKDTHPKFADEKDTENLCDSLVTALKDAMDKNAAWKIDVSVSDRRRKISFYAPLTGHDLKKQPG